MVTKTASRLDELARSGEAIFRRADPKAKNRPLPTFKLKRGMRLERVVKKH